MFLGQQAYQDIVSYKENQLSENAYVHLLRIQDDAQLAIGFKGLKFIVCGASFENSSETSARFTNTNWNMMTQLYFFENKLYSRLSRKFLGSVKSTVH